MSGVRGEMPPIAETQAQVQLVRELHGALQDKLQRGALQLHMNSAAAGSAP